MTIPLYIFNRKFNGIVWRLSAWGKPKGLFDDDVICKWNIKLK